MNREMLDDSGRLRADLKAEAPPRGCLFLLVVFAAVILLQNVLGPYAEYLWYQQDAGRPEVFAREYGTKSLLFLGAFLIALGTFWLNLRLALSQTPVYSSYQRLNPALARLFDFVVAQGAHAAKYLAVVFAFLYALGAPSSWQTYLLFSHPQSFGKADPLFGLDYGYFVFKWPFVSAVVEWTLGLLVFNLVLCVAAYALFGGLAALSRAEVARPQVSRQLGVLAGLVALAFGANAWVGRYGFVMEDGFQFTGAGFTAVQRLPLETAFAALVIGFGLLMLLVSLARPASSGRFLVGGVVGLFAFNILVVNLYPSVVIQRFQVEGDKVNKEAPFAARAIAATRFGLGLDVIEARDIAVRDEPTAQEASASQATLENMRLWDPKVVNQTLQGIQGLRPYYSFDDVDVDRYSINGKKRLVMLSARNMDHEGLSGEARTWVNTALQYTHGYGLAMSQVNESSAMGQPTFLIGDMPIKTPADIPVKEPRIYFSDYGGRTMPGAIVASGIDEFDYPMESGSQSHRWTGSRGIHVGSLGTKLLMSVVLGDGNLLVSPNIQNGTRLLRYRDVRTRVSKLYPSISLDRDPYLVVTGGRLVWVLDGYTTSSSLPYSEHVAAWGNEVNYVRNSVKFALDAYSGDLDAYVVNPGEPVLKALAEIYPGAFKDMSQAPADLREHFRYPEDLFSIQARALAQYHVTDPKQFLANNDAWDIPYNRGLSGERAPLDPYYVLMKLPDEPKEGFLLMLPFTPRQKDNMSGWLAAHCDPDSYGKLVLYRFARGSLISGPAQMESIFNQDRAIADINRQLSNEQSRIIVGNLLVIPIGQSVMYVEPLFLQSRTPGIQPIPELKKVILALKGKVVVGDTYSEALGKLFGSAPASSSPVPNPGKPSAEGMGPQTAQELLTQFEAADQALRTGDFAKYGEIQKQLRDKLKALAGK